MQKNKRLLLITCLTSLVLPSLGNATVTRITSYTDLLNALKNGHRVNVVAENGKCKLVEPSKAPSADDPNINAVIGFSFNSNFFLTYRDDNDPRNYLVTIATNTISGSDTSPKHRYKRVKIYDDNTAEVFAGAGDFQSGESTGSIRTLCNISNGHDQNGVSLFDYDAGSIA